MVEMEYREEMTDKRLAEYWARLQNALGFATILAILRELVEECNTEKK